MNLNHLNNDSIKDIIPNVLLEVEGESPLALKLQPWLSAAKDWLEAEYLGPEDFLSDQDNLRAVRIVALKAFADAIPSLDIVVTPTGFGVVSTDAIAPASKERIDRLVNSLRNEINSELKLLIDCCHLYPKWRSSDRGSYFCSSFLSSLNDFRDSKFISFDELRSEAINVESIMADLYLGHKLMSRLRDIHNSRQQNVSNKLAELLHNAISNVVYRSNAPILQIIWHNCRNVIETLHNFPEFYELWHDEMGCRFENLAFENKVKGSFFF